mmetsp:Transcript_11813/g.24971  ORF Transcript_11813/g.24971 Transcript_11813/m.24971 type:complete len:227 (+) Transcript_11813:184-864(+)|eukprot:CAMPEP_0201132096 /NCGR_PEP_ID=MMETSP0850-20130426/44792_1 /ASSEMBLY_ACC=CAM_ASM_000622 /TAXON_ID=183588 /ORGANISM="Pseudo-nitzschia fraudulenta, Strain WWA7" /LENGTH=226 /DNA_ID=CAMNT_0047402339 /DNA_START=27 /DNA_END=707 /DNA_ORIENTATION=-
MTDDSTPADQATAPQPAATASPDDTAESSASASALEDNIATKGNNSYYFAHKHKANGPKWDGKAEPKSLSKDDMEALSLEDPTKLLRQSGKKASFAYHESNITSYAFLNEDKVVKLYISMEGIGEQCSDEDVKLDWDESSLSLVIRNYHEPKTTDATTTAKASPEGEVTVVAKKDRSLSFGRLTAKICHAKYKLKPNKIIVTLKKEKAGVEWHTINDKGSPDHEVV